ncbi:hypothetical protein VP01_142g3 [Puccinia sorghi]|uniref:Uncharacterized protein n=1 Tax=Puccinia sorghi TaxID=27349 RepID=A0A0L6VKF5_9BASI|nr:hypothetical protein VP01_142g3 [Puccinia sorghi]
MEGADFIPQEINCVFEHNNGGQLEYYNYCMLILYNAIPVCMLGRQKFFELDEVSCILTNTLGDPTNCFSKYILAFSPAFERAINTPQQILGVLWLVTTCKIKLNLILPVPQLSGVSILTVSNLQFFMKIYPPTHFGLRISQTTSMLDIHNVMGVVQPIPGSCFPKALILFTYNKSGTGH